MQLIDPGEACADHNDIELLYARVGGTRHGSSRAHFNSHPAWSRGQVPRTVLVLPQRCAQFSLVARQAAKLPAGLSSALHKSARMWLKPVKRAAAIAAAAFLCSSPGLGACGNTGVVRWAALPTLKGTVKANRLRRQRRSITQPANGDAIASPPNRQRLHRPVRIWLPQTDVSRVLRRCPPCSVAARSPTQSWQPLHRPRHTRRPSSQRDRSIASAALGTALSKSCQEETVDGHWRRTSPVTRASNCESSRGSGLASNVLIGPNQCIASLV